MKVGFITAFGVGMGHIARCMALRAGLEERGHEIVGCFSKCDWRVIDEGGNLPIANWLTYQGKRQIIINDGNREVVSTPDNTTVITPHLQPQLAWVGTEPPFKAVQMGMSPRGLAIEHELEAFDMGSDFGYSQWVLGAPGHSSWERCAYGVPTMQVIFAESQLLVAEACEKAGAAVTVWNELEEGAIVPERLRARVIAAVDKYDACDVAEAARQLCDGNGVARTIEMMEAAIC